MTSVEPVFLRRAIPRVGRDVREVYTVIWQPLDQPWFR